MLRFPNGSMTPRRVFCIGCNYDAHIKEMGETDADRCVVFMKPPESLAPVGEQVAIPKDRGTVHHEVELVVAICGEGRNIPRDGAADYIAGVTLGLDLTLREVQARLKKRGHPWELCKAFEQSAPVGDFIEYDSKIDLSDIDMKCLVNGKVRQEGSTGDMLFPVGRLIEILSRTWRLQEGDLIFTGTPPGVGPILPGDEVTIESSKIGRFSWPIA